MKHTITRLCGKCKRHGAVTIVENSEITCPHCQEVWGRVDSLESVFDACPVCQCKQFYISKDFNQVIGCLILIIGIALVPVTYGLSLPVFALLDYLLHRRVPTLINCYKCGSEFRGFPNTKKFKPFMHHIGVKYDKYR